MKEAEENIMGLGVTKILIGITSLKRKRRILVIKKTKTMVYFLWIIILFWKTSD